MFTPMIAAASSHQFCIAIGAVTVCARLAGNNICSHRFDGQYGELPKGYDHKYVYSHFGYNLKGNGYAGGNRL